MNRRWRLATQITILTTVVTVVAVAISFIVSANLIRRTAETQARQTLGHYADLIADGDATIRTPLIGKRRATAPAVKALYRVAQIVPVRIAATGTVTGTASGRLPAALPTDLITAAAAGQSVDEVLTLAGHHYFVEGRPLVAGGSVVLLQPESVAGQITSPLRGRVLIALAAGLLVAILAGALLSRRLARPLVRAAGAATELAHGHRDVALPSTGPAEVVAVSEALNDLSAALGSSEARQRDFLLSVSHELRTPLTAITGYAEALADQVVTEPAEVAAVGATMQIEALRLQRLVTDLLDLGRLGAADFQVVPAAVDITALLAAAAEVWTVRCSAASVQLRCELPTTPLVITTDSGRVRQIIDGLAENALRATPAGCPIVLAAREVDGIVELEVRDGGPGLSDDDIQIAFERSALAGRYRGVRRVGTGIGLALIAGLADRLGGHAIAGHAAEGGARFTITLPGPALHTPNIP